MNQKITKKNISLIEVTYRQLGIEYTLAHWKISKSTLYRLRKANFSYNKYKKLISKEASRLKENNKPPRLDDRYFTTSYLEEALKKERKAEKEALSYHPKSKLRYIATPRSSGERKARNDYRTVTRLYDLEATTADIAARLANLEKQINSSGMYINLVMLLSFISVVIATLIMFQVI